MDYGYYLKNYTPSFDKLKNGGFEERGGVFTKRLELSEGGLYMLVAVSRSTLDMKIMDGELEEEFLPSLVKGAPCAARAEAEAILENIINCCFECADTESRTIAFIERNFPVKAEHPFSGYPDVSAFYTPGRHKWFALILGAPKKALGLAGEGEVRLVNLKAEAADIERLADGAAYFRAYHMNKRSWLSVALDKNTDFEELLSLLKKSYAMTN